MVAGELCYFMSYMFTYGYWHKSFIVFDDLIFFLKDDGQQVYIMKSILMGFEIVSGLWVNFRKSTVVGLGQLHNGKECAEVFGCSMNWLPIDYLGIILGSN